ncbi:hypothetical protein TNCV_1300951 [Trichonephila clavipes]|nr:hypothetical protein TNCV_1300951 [Trichonephila clavipes]
MKNEGMRKNGMRNKGHDIPGCIGDPISVPVSKASFQTQSVSKTPYAQQLMPTSQENAQVFFHSQEDSSRRFTSVDASHQSSRMDQIDAFPEHISTTVVPVTLPEKPDALVYAARKRKRFDQKAYKLPPPTPFHVPFETKKRPLEQPGSFSKKKRVFITPVIRPPVSPVLIIKPSTALATPQPVSIPEPPERKRPQILLSDPLPERTTPQILLPDPLPERTTPQILLPDPPPVLTTPHILLSDPLPERTTPQILLPDPPPERTTPQILLPDPPPVLTTPQILLPDPPPVLTTPQILLPDPSPVLTTPQILLPDPPVVETWTRPLLMTL